MRKCECGGKVIDPWPDFGAFCDCCKKPFGGEDLALNEELKLSIKIGSDVWKDVPDAGKYVREKRDSRTCLK